MESALRLRPESRDEFEIAIICALPVEWNAVEALMEEDYEEGEFSYRKKDGDRNAYTTGWLGNQHVVLVYMPSMGMAPSAAVATQLRSSFKNIKAAFLVGICGGVPKTPAREEIVLGDVIISASVIQVDFGQQYPHQKQAEDRLSRASPEIRAFVGKLSGYLASTRLKAKINAYSSEICSQDKFSGSAYPGPEKDQLYQVDYVHKHWKQGVCSICDKCIEPGDEVCDEALTASCAELGCEATNLVERTRLREAIGTRLSKNQSSTTKMQEARQACIHFGRIACSNQVRKSGLDRDRIAAHEGVIGFEMESAGLWDYIPTIVIKSVCDYADSHKDKRWQLYAARTAAACTKAVLEEWRNVDGPIQNPVTQQQLVTNAVHWTVTRHPNRLFTGRDVILRDLESIVCKAAKDPSRRDQCSIVITGMGGQGKSELCLQLVNRVRQSFWGIFWVDVSTKSLAQSGFLDIASRVKIPVQSWEDARQDLANRSEPWLLVLDNADDPEVDYQQYFPTSPSGIIILTSRNADYQQYATEKWVNLDNLPNEEACELLLQASRVAGDRHQMLNDDASIVVDLLGSHPLALLQAGSYVSHGHCTLKNYPEVFNQHRKRLLTFRPSRVHSRYQDAYTMFEASVRMLHSSNTESAKDALDLLPVLASCTPKRLPITSLFEAAWKGVAMGVEDYSEDDLLLLTPWHVSHLLPLIQAGSTSWDSFRLIEAIRQLEAFSLVTVDASEGSPVVSMHPLTHYWAKDRLSTEQKHASWIATGCLFGFSTTDTMFWQKYGQQLQPHLQKLVSIDIKEMFMNEPPLMICRILLTCGRQIEKLRDNTTFILLVDSLFTHLDLELTATEPRLDRYLQILRTRRNEATSKASDQGHNLTAVKDALDRPHVPGL